MLQQQRTAAAEQGRDRAACDIAEGRALHIMSCRMVLIVLL